MVLIKVAGKEVIDAPADGVAEGLDRLIVSAVTAIVAQIDDGAAKAEIVPAFGPGKVLVDLAEILRAATGISTLAWIKWHCSRQRDVIRSNSSSDFSASKIESGHNTRYTRPMLEILIAKAAICNRQ